MDETSPAKNTGIGVTKFYCITLEKTPERTKHAKEQFEREGVPVEWVYGIDAKEMGVGAFLYMHRNTPDKKGYFISPGMACLVLSHYMAFRWAERDQAEDFVIFEDDVVLPEDFLGKLEIVKHHCPKDTLAVWLEYCCCTVHEGKKATHGLYYGNPLCTAAVWYRKEAIPIILKALHPAHAPVDILIKHKAGGLKQCITSPQMCTQIRYNDTFGSTLHREMPTEPPFEIS